jgi:hypothetical protein
LVCIVLYSHFCFKKGSVGHLSDARCQKNLRRVKMKGLL